MTAPLSSPQDAIQLDIDRVAGFPGMDDFGPYYSKMRATYLVYAELAKADAAMEALYEIHPIDDTWYAEEKRLSNHLQDMREKLCEVLR